MDTAICSRYSLRTDNAQQFKLAIPGCIQVRQNNLILLFSHMNSMCSSLKLIGLESIDCTTRLTNRQ